MKDKLGQEIQIGDMIAWAVGGYSFRLDVGEVLAVRSTTLTAKTNCGNKVVKPYNCLVLSKRDPIHEGRVTHLELHNLIYRYINK